MTRSRIQARRVVGLVVGCSVLLGWLSPQVPGKVPAFTQALQCLAAQVQLGARDVHRQAIPSQWARSVSSHAVPASMAVRIAGVARESKGTDFWLTFPGNLARSQLSLFLTGDEDTTGTVTIPGLGFAMSFSVTAGAVTTVTLPALAALGSSDTIENKGIHITALHEVAVYGLRGHPFTTDAYLGLPTDVLGTEYIVLGYQNANVVNGTQLAIVATANATTVTITPSVTTNSRRAAVPYHMTLNQGQTYQLRNTGPPPTDLSGTMITSDQPIAVFGGHQCANIPPEFAACDYIVEQLPPTVAWGKTFVTMPLATRLHGDTFRFLASTDGTNIRVNGTWVATLPRGQLHEQLIAGPAQISADQPILVAQYSNGSSFDGVASDPFMMLIPPFEQFLTSYTLTTPTAGFPRNFLNVVTLDAAVGAITLDGTVIPPSSFVAIGTSGFSGAQVPLPSGSHTVIGPLPFGAFVYGFADTTSYGYPAGMSVVPVALVAAITLTPKTATNLVGLAHCVMAAVTDQNGDPVAEVRVDFTVTGANPTAGFTATDASGQAPFCYGGAHAGTDTIVAAVGTVADTATETWDQPSLQFSDGTNVLVFDVTTSQFILAYMTEQAFQQCSGAGARVDEGLLTISSACREDVSDVIRAVGPAGDSVTVELIDSTGTSGGSPVIRRFLLTRQ